MKGNPTVEQWLAKLPADLQRITTELIKLARENMPGVHEFIYHDAVGYSVNDSPFDRVCYIAPQQKGYVNFGFFFGVGLPDPQRLLVGEGKRMRHVKILRVEEARNPALGKMIVAAWKRGSQSISKVHAGIKKSKA